MQKRALFVGFSRAKSKWKIGSILIRWAEAPRSLFSVTSWLSLYRASHVFAVFPKTPGRPFYMVNEAAGTELRFVSQPNFEDHALVTDLYRFEFSDEVYRAIKLYGALHAGSPYAFFENVGIVWVRLVQAFTNKTIPNPFGVGERAQKCSEFVVRNIVERVMPLKTLSVEVFNDVGYELPADIENIGVRDISVILDYLVRKGLCVQVPVWAGLDTVEDEAA